MRAEEVLRALHALGLEQGYEDYLRWKRARRVGFIVNPVAGMGGAIGLKGTDGITYSLALARGGKPVAPLKATSFLSLIKPLGNAIELLTPPKLMGAREAEAAGLKAEVVGEVGDETSAGDTKATASEMLDRGAELLVFVGGDGTARDIYDAVKDAAPVIGVPSGVKMYSPVFAVNVLSAARMLIEHVRFGLPCVEREVMDVDEGAFREGRFSIRVYGRLKTFLKASALQPPKRLTSESDREAQLEIARYVVENMERETVYVIGPGTTTYCLAEVGGFEKTLLGVDLILNGKTIAKDVDEKTILKAIDGRRARVIVTPVGGQGFIFGRGNQQISAEVLRRVGKSNIIVIATESKLEQLESLRVDTGDQFADDMLRGTMEVVVGYGKKALMDVA